MLSETSQTRSWLKTKLQTIKRTGLQFSDDILISILVCLMSRDKHLMLTCKQEHAEELKTMVEQIFHNVFGLSCATVTCDASQTPADFIANLFSRPKDDSYSNSTHIGNSIQNSADDSFNRLQPQKSYRSLITTSSTNSNEKKPSPEFKGIKRQSNLSHSPSRLNHNRDSPIDTSFSDEELSINAINDIDEYSSRKFTERSRTLDNPKESNFVSSNAHPRRRNTFLASSTSTQPIDIPERSSTPSRPNLSIYTGSPRKNTHSSNYSHLNSYSQSPNTPIDFSISKRTHGSIGTGGFDSYPPHNSASRKLAQAVIIESLSNANEIIFAFLLEILAHKEVIDKSTTFYLPKPFLIVALLPETYPRHSLPNQLMDRFFISYLYEGIIGFGKSQIINRRNPMIKESEIEKLSKDMDNVSVQNDMQRYMRDIVVGLRTHRIVKRGITARASTDLVTFVKALAAVFQRNYVTPELVLFASEKIFSHRIILREVGDDRSTMYGTNLKTLLKKVRGPTTSSDVIADVLRAVYPPV
ncbi:13308_t:CDS:2 [Cetraspora pellucida]|uniref:magnesium chelatase n=1 Tax=Cetraspora pellucida TaxID=1433469 RepID=A0A9N9BKI3_9GLOM|nr:13308_t:CDS:2 [Cetraspora pellucida]